MNILKSLVRGIREELLFLKDSLRRTKMTAGFAFAILCVALIIVGNVALLIAINFWLSIFTEASVTQRGQQIAIQVVTMIFLVMIFASLGVAFIIHSGAAVVWRTLTATNRVRGPWYRLLLLFLSGTSNGVSSLLAVYAMNGTPQFVQAILMCTIPFSAQAWTVVAIPDERRRNYRSVFFVMSSICAVAGILLGSLMYFIHVGSNVHVSWVWALIYFLSCIIFGYWCVVQRLYLEAVAMAATPAAKDEAKERQTSRSGDEAAVRGNSNEYDPHAVKTEPVTGVHDVVKDAPRPNLHHHNNRSAHACTNRAHAEYDAEEDNLGNHDHMEQESMMAHCRGAARQWQWGRNTVDDVSAKLVLLVVSIFFQAVVSFLLFPIDAIPSFGLSSDVSSAWYGFCSSVRFIFRSWYNVKYGVIYFTGFAMSFVGCTYLNEYSPTLASVVLQLAGPLTSLIIIVVPRWNVYQIQSNVGQQIASVVLLTIAALLYYLWENRTTRQLAEAALLGEHPAYSPV